MTPPVCLCAFAAAAIAKTPPMATGMMAWKIAKGLYIVPLLFAYTPFLDGNFVTALTVFFFGTIGIYALTGAMEGYLENPIAWPLRPVLLGCGGALLWPLDTLWHALALTVFVATFLLSRRMAGAISSSPQSTI